MGTPGTRAPKELEGVPVEDIMGNMSAALARSARLGGVRGRQDRRLQARAAPLHRRRRLRQARRSDGDSGQEFHAVDHVCGAGKGNAAHTHEVEECFFVLQGYLDVFVEDETASASPRGSARGNASRARPA